MPIKDDHEVFVLEIAARPVLIFNGSSRAEADEFIKSGSFETDLRVYVSEGRPLWSGDRRDLLVRAALDHEQGDWEIYWENGVKSGEIDEDDVGPHECWLVALSDPH